MKTSQFITSAIGFLYSLTLGNWIVLAFFGVSALISFRRMMRELEEEGEKSYDGRRI